VTAAAADVKACCAAAYSSPVVTWLLGTRLHPGGKALTEHLICTLAVGPAAVVADVACGQGETSLEVVRTTGARAIGVDLSAHAVTEARQAAERAGLTGSVEFLVGDADALPLDDRSVDAVLCECALCIFPDKHRAATELARVLKPGGTLALSDVIAEQERLPAALRTLDARVACLADALPLRGLLELLAAAGLRVDVVERHEDALAGLLDRVEGRLRLAAAALPREADIGLVERGRELVSAARTSVGLGILGYAVVVARRPVSRADATGGRAGASNLV
jgi:arsenite methyltransferase